MIFRLCISIIPSIIIAFIIYLSDKKEKEPLGKIIKAYILGIISVSLVLWLSKTLNIEAIDTENSSRLNIFIYAFFMIAVVEELAKWLCSYLSVKNNSDYNYMYDGIVYFAYVALGFATVENGLYAMAGDMETVFIRAITTVPSHVAFGIVSGYYFSIYRRELYKNKKMNAYRNLALSLYVPIILHGFYDYCLLLNNYIFFITYIVFVSTLYTLTISRALRMERIDHRLDDTKIYCRYCGKVMKNNKCLECDKEE